MLSAGTVVDPVLLCAVAEEVDEEVDDDDGGDDVDDVDADDEQPAAARATTAATATIQFSGRTRRNVSPLEPRPMPYTPLA